MYKYSMMYIRSTSVLGVELGCKHSVGRSMHRRLCRVPESLDESFF